MKRRSPISFLYLDVNQNCNMSCVMCDMVRTGAMIDDIWFGDFIDRNDDIFRSVKTVVIGHQAEPLLNPDVTGVIELFKRRQAEVIMITNGKLLPERMNGICATWLDTLLFSVDSHNHETLEKIRRGIDAEQLFSSIGRIAGKKKESLKLVFNVCLMRRNIEDLPQIIELAAKLNVDEVRWQFLIVGKPELIQESLYFCQEKTNRYMALAEETAKRVDILFQPKYFRKDGIEPETLRKCCHMPFDTLYINGNGDCFACYMHFLGNIKDNTIMDIWHGQEILKIRESVSKPGSPYCQNCTYCEVQNVDYPESFFSDKIYSDLSDRLIRKMGDKECTEQEVKQVFDQSIEKMALENEIINLYRQASAFESKGELMKSKSLFLKILNDSRQLNRELQGGVHFHLGMISHSLGDIDQMKLELQECLKLVPDHRKAMQCLTDLSK